MSTLGTTSYNGHKRRREREDAEKYAVKETIPAAKKLLLLRNSRRRLFSKPPPERTTRDSLVRQYAMT